VPSDRYEDGQGAQVSDLMTWMAEQEAEMSFVDHDDERFRGRASTFGGAVRYGAPPKPNDVASELAKLQASAMSKPKGETALGVAIGDLMKLRLNSKLPVELTPDVDRIVMNLMLHRQSLNS